MTAATDLAIAMADGAITKALEIETGSLKPLGEFGGGDTLVKDAAEDRTFVSLRIDFRVNLSPS